MARSPLYEADYRPLFSGHETFPLRYGWLKKAFDSVGAAGEEANSKAIFRDDAAIARFGVGKNMVRSIRHWASCCGVLDEDPRTGQIAPTDFGKFLFGHHPFDQYLEKPASLWLIHWILCTTVSTRPAKTTWYWTFNHYTRSSFSRDELTDQLMKIANAQDWKRVSRTTVRRDVECFVRTYEAKTGGDIGTIESNLESPLAELGLVRSSDRQHYLVRGSKPSLPNSVFAFALNQFWRQHATAATLSYEKIAHEPGSPGRVFLLDEPDLAERLLALEDITQGALRWSETAGLQQVYRTNLVDDKSALALVREESHAPSGKVAT
ncbi:MAG: DUF4007 family protein [Planctomycetota bacterium]|nr:DUF4007 family protein [Planctomycetota bacterium]